MSSNNQNLDDYYRLLNVSTNASSEEIKKAYRRLAMEHHPDRNNGNREAEERLKAINQAYQILGDAEKRRHYDFIRLRFSRNQFMGVMPTAAGGVNSNVNFGYDFATGRRGSCKGFGFKGKGRCGWWFLYPDKSGD